MYLWDYLENVNKPVVLYGMGNGGDKIFEKCDERGIRISGVFSSDDHRTDAVFHGFPVVTLKETLSSMPDPVILLAFGTERPELLTYMKGLAEKYEIYAPDVPLCGGPDFTPEYRDSIEDQIRRARKLMADEQSLKVFDGLLDYKETCRVDKLIAIESDPDEKRELIPMGENAAFLDLGAFNGDTIDEFLDWTKGEYRAVYAFEPDAHNLKKLREHTAGLDHVEICPYASWDRDTVLTFTGKGGRNCGIETDLPGKKFHPHPVEARRVDDFRLDITHAKLDVEGAERETLLGMRETIVRCHPSMQISVYHKTDDFITIPLLLEEICPGYRMYLRHHPSLPAWELQLYCLYGE